MDASSKVAHSPFPTFLILAAIAVTAARAQAPAFRANTRLVEVTAVAKDRHGSPVLDLKAGDFEIYDNGEKQDIRVFRVEEYRRSAPARVAAAVPAPAPAGATTFSNRPRVEPGAQNAPTVIVIDVGNTWDPSRMTWADLVYAREQLIKFLGQLRRDDRLGIYLMGQERFWILREYSEPCADLLDRLAAWKERRTADPGATKYRDVWTEFAVRIAGVDAQTAKAIHRDQFFSVPSPPPSALPDHPSALEQPARGTPGEPARIERTSASTLDHGSFLTADQNSPVAILRAVAYHLASVPGRKNAIVISGKMFLPSHPKDQLQVLHEIVQTGVAVYTIDPGGLAPYAIDASFVIPSSVIMGAGSNREIQLAAQRHAQQNFDWKQQLTLYLQSSLTAVAEATGGQVYVNTNDIQGAIRRSFDDSSVTYTLGFYPKESLNDGSFHRLKVKLVGQQHLTLRHRSGYFEPDPPSQDAGRREAELHQAAWGPLDATGIELSGTISPAAAAGRELKLNIGLASASLQRETDRWSGQVEVVVVQRDNFGNEYGSFAQTVGLKLKQESYERALQNGLPYAHAIDLEPEATSVRVIVRDPNSGNIGTLTIPTSAAGR